jgi:hypothetical protein
MDKEKKNDDFEILRILKCSLTLVGNTEVYRVYITIFGRRFVEIQEYRTFSLSGGSHQCLEATVLNVT